MIENTHAKKAFFFHTESLTQGKIFSNNSAVNSQCLQGHFFYFFSFLVFVLMDVVIVSLQTFFGICYGDQYKQHDRATPPFFI